MQHDFDIATADANTGLTFRAAVNAALQALAGLSSGASAPTTPYAYQLWADTTTGLLKIRNAANSDWITIGTLATAFLGLATLGTAQTITAQHTFNPGAAGAPFVLGANALAQIVTGLNADYLDGKHAAEICPAGMIAAWTTETAPTGWLECDGAAVSRTTYAGLFAVISDDYGPGNGTTTFNLPDLRGRFLRGWAHGQATDPDRATRTDRGDGTTGDHVGTKQTGNYASHYHRVGYPTGLGTLSPTGTVAKIEAGAGDFNTEPSGGNETRPLNTNVMWIIKY